MHRLPFAILLLVVSALPLRAERAEHAFALSMAGLGVASVTLVIDGTDGGYTASARVRGRGLVGSLVDVDYDGFSRGRLGPDGMPVPELFRSARADDDDGGRKTVIRYAGGTPVSVTADPPYPARPWTVDPRTQRRTLDPIAAGVAIIGDRPVGEACDRTVEVFDGRRHSRVKLGPRSKSRNFWTCPGTYSRVAGYPPKKMAEQVDFPFVITYQEVDGILRVVRIDMESTFGSARLQRR